MHNENSTAGKEQVSQDRLEALFKLAHSGSSPDTISFALKIDIETVQQLIAMRAYSRSKTESAGAVASLAKTPQPGEEIVEVEVLPS
jgi:hypothetical protein